MNIIESFLTAWNALRANKLRALLTMLGIIIGVGAVITVVALGEGARRAVNERLKGLGTDILFVRPGSHDIGHAAQGSGTAVTLKIEDAEIINNESDAILDYSAELSRNAQVKYLNTNINTQIAGTTIAYPYVRNFQIAEGRFFNSEEFKTGSKVCIMGNTAYQNLFEATPPIGKILKIKGQNFQVIGVFAAKGQAGMQNQDDQIIIPLSTAQLRLFGIDYISGISFKVTAQAALDDATFDIERILRRRHRLRSDQENDFEIRNQADIITTAQETNQTLSVLLASIAAISLIVGGIGIMNIMIVSVTERTKEIGIRKAVGAKKKDILIQFIIEALLICLIGGILGIALALLASSVLEVYAGWNLVIVPEAVALSFGLSVLVGLTFGFYPALKAARANVVESLRYE
jgi:putative ABC transport system permease protein